MGLFSSETVTTVGTSVSRLVQDKNVVDSSKVAIATALFTGEDMVDHILDSSFTSIANKADRMYEYAKRSYTYGLPTGEVYSNTQGAAQVQAVLDALEGQNVFVEYRRFGQPNLIHKGWMKLLAEHGYNPQTNELTHLSAQKGTKVYLKGMYAEVPASKIGMLSKGQLEIWDTPPNAGYTPEQKINLGAFAEAYYKGTPAVVSNSISSIRLRVKYIWVPNSRWYWDEYSTAFSEGEFTIELPGVEDDIDFFQVKYSFGNTVKYWSYQYGTGGQPSLDSVFTNSPDVVGDFYPNIYFRLNKTDMTANKTTDAYRTSKKLAKYLGIGYDDLGASIHENPGIGDVEQAFLTMAVPANSTDAIELRYLYEFANKLYEANSDSALPITQSYLTRFLGGLFTNYNNPTNSVKSIVIRDGAFQMVLFADAILKSRKVGNTGAIGTVTSGTGSYTYQVEAQDNDVVGSVLSTRTATYRYYRKQVSANFYEEIQIIGWQMRYYVYGKYHTVLGDDLSEQLLIPIDRSITRNYNGKDKEYLFTRSLHMVINSRVTQELEWYEQGWFADLIQIVGVVITVWSMGTDGGFFATAAAAITAGAYATLVNMIVVGLIKYLVVQELFKLFVKAVGIELAFVAALFAAAYGMTEMIKDGTIKVTATAKDLLSLANGLTSGIGNALNDMMGDLMDEFKEFDLMKDAKLELLEKGEDLLKSTSLLSPFVVLGEDPSIYFKRTAHSGNIGTLLLDDVHNYVSRSLTLPDFSTTLGGYEYGAI